MERVKNGEKYWIVNSDCRVTHFREEGDAADEYHFESDNYFHTKEEAEAIAEKFRAVLKGADVIEMPSEEEIRSACIENIPCWCKDGDPSQYWRKDGDSSQFIDCNMCFVEDARKMFCRGVEWLKSKIVK